METVFVKPREGGRIRQPERQGRVMPEAGALVPRVSYYERLILTGDVVISSAPQPVAAAAPALAEHDDHSEAHAAEASPLPALSSMPSPRSS